MTTFRPFRGIRPVRDKAHLIASRSFVSYTKRQLDFKLSTNPYSFIHVINPEWGMTPTARPNSVEKFRLVRDKFKQFFHAGYFKQETRPSYYLYEQETQSNTFTGFIGANSIDDYFSGKIKKHEATLAKREEIFKDYLDVCEINAEPVLLSYPDDKVLEVLMQRYKSTRAEYEFSTADGVKHQLWVIDNPGDVGIVNERFRSFGALYIADGHHRSASSSLLGKERREKNPGYSGEEPFNFFMSYCVAESQLKIWDYNRLVCDLNNLSTEEFLSQLKKRFIVTEQNHQHKPGRLHNFGLYIDGKWYSLSCRETQESPVLDTLDSHLLTRDVLSPILGIHDLRTDRRVSFLPGNAGLSGIENQVNSGKYRAGFALFPVSINQLKAVADASLIMPPKSTWVEPKLRSGLIVYSL